MSTFLTCSIFSHVVSLLNKHLKFINNQEPRNNGYSTRPFIIFFIGLLSIIITNSAVKIGNINVGIINFNIFNVKSAVDIPFVK